MQKFGGLLVFFGLGSIVLNFLGREFVLTMWLDNWGPSMGLAIRIGMSVVGAVLWFVGMRTEDSADIAEQPES